VRCLLSTDVPPKRWFYKTNTAPRSRREHCLEMVYVYASVTWKRRSKQEFYFMNKYLEIF
jgi:hypothetical protein